MYLIEISCSDLILVPGERGEDGLMIVRATARVTQKIQQQQQGGRRGRGRQRSKTVTKTVREGDVQFSNQSGGSTSTQTPVNDWGSAEHEFEIRQRDHSSSVVISATFRGPDGQTARSKSVRVTVPARKLVLNLAAEGMYVPPFNEISATVRVFHNNSPVSGHIGRVVGKNLSAHHFRTDDSGVARIVIQIPEDFPYQQTTLVAEDLSGNSSGELQVELIRPSGNPKLMVQPNTDEDDNARFFVRLLVTNEHGKRARGKVRLDSRLNFTIHRVDNAVQLATDCVAANLEVDDDGRLDIYVTFNGPQRTINFALEGNEEEPRRTLFMKSNKTLHQEGIRT